MSLITMELYTTVRLRHGNGTQTKVTAKLPWVEKPRADQGRMLLWEKYH